MVLSKTKIFLMIDFIILINYNLIIGYSLFYFADFLAKYYQKELNNAKNFVLFLSKAERIYNMFLSVFIFM
jgi:SNF family Na+-dependent transporter